MKNVILKCFSSKYGRSVVFLFCLVILNILSMEQSARRGVSFLTLVLGGLSLAFYLGYEVHNNSVGKKVRIYAPILFAVLTGTLRAIWIQLALLYGISFKLGIESGGEGNIAFMAAFALFICYIIAICSVKLIDFIIERVEQSKTVVDHN